jgi:phage/plasmid-associated DNA primase
MRWQATGRLVTPQCMLEAVQDYRSDEDPFASFLEDCCVAEAGASVPLVDLLSRYQDWHDETPGALHLTQKSLPPQVEGHGYKVKRKAGGRIALGLRLKDSEPSQDRPDTTPPAYVPGTGGHPDDEVEDVFA